MQNRISLLNGAWEPVTQSVGLIRAPHDKVLETLMRWKRPLVAEYGATLETRTVHGGLEDGLKALLPLQSPQCDKYLLLPTANPEWTAIYDNGKRGTEVHSLCFSMWNLFGIEAINVINIPHTIDKARTRGQYGCRAIEHIGPHGERWIRVMHGLSRWEFMSVGTPFAFEDVAAYDQPGASKRFTQEMMVRYLAALDLHPFESDFYCPDSKSTILSEAGQSFERKYWTLDEARSGIIDLTRPVLPLWED